MDTKTKIQLRGEARGAKMNISCVLVFNLAAMFAAGVVMNVEDHWFWNLTFFATFYTTLCSYITGREGWRLAYEVEQAIPEETSTEEDIPAHVTGESSG